MPQFFMSLSILQVDMIAAVPYVYFFFALFHIFRTIFKSNWTNRRMLMADLGASDR